MQRGPTILISKDEKEQTLAKKPAGFFVSTRTQGGGQETIATIEFIVYGGILIKMGSNHTAGASRDANRPHSLHVWSRNVQNGLDPWRLVCSLVMAQEKLGRQSWLLLNIKETTWLQLSRDLHNLEKKYKRQPWVSNQGDGLMTLKLGWLTTVVISSPEAAKEVLKTHDHVLCYRISTDPVRATGHHERSFAWLPPFGRWR
ncbi:hypothetical protein DY000_02056776 [Brassica cretica]|uniref:Uncharacterized protein n=1 Tax=Brassica cretica TaxID=69181 RepID=A0ABQ7ADF3_BRACR|nr:hypothetical protein DY000_02056776 [Brassica cretica]